MVNWNLQPIESGHASQLLRCLLLIMKSAIVIWGVAESASAPRPAPGAGTFQARCGSFRDLVSVIWGVAESASQRLITGRNGQVQTDTLTDQVN
jgi:hypothetical protein